MEVSVMMTESVLVMTDLRKMVKEYVKVSDFLYLLYHKGLRVEMNEDISVCCVAVFSACNNSVKLRSTVANFLLMADCSCVLLTS